ncbi:Uncharacterized protein TPAR_05008 [Tolypocladium paradoxum]|uniref:Uncharacterized protein n=1 Tax=Tolypocladium paradoxum TaxID=94208 RepID=A0A2S4KX75_9HYPO|nr:Uncharacterized protein TPAR_05008 [Tolypocladium paradoxum]
MPRRPTRHPLGNIARRPACWAFKEARISTTTALTCSRIAMLRVAPGTLSTPANSPAYYAGIRIAAIRLWTAGVGRRAIGVLFKLELALYGYTFVGKGILSSYFYRLKHESRSRLAGGYVLPSGARVVYMMLMLWAGEVAAENEESRRVMLVDFNRAALLPAPKHRQLSKLSRNKRKRPRDVARNYTQKRSIL